MNKKKLFAITFILSHFVLVAGFVPLANIVPAALGALAISAMALSLVLAARWRIVDRITGGPDKSYVLHRYLGFFAILGVLGHWALASSFGEGLVPILAESGEDAGNIAAFSLLGMSAAALIRVIPYHLWKASHMLMGPIFLIAVYHTFLAATPLVVGSLPWIVMVIMSVLGLAGWLQTLWRKRSPTRLVGVNRVTPFEGGADISIIADRPLPSFYPGQFSTLAYNEPGAEAHPFTVAGGDEATRRFIIRATGDWTKNFVASVRPGDQLRLGRAAGRFRPGLGTKCTNQLWVAGGVGITPFLATLEALEPNVGPSITLVYCIRSRDSAGGLTDIAAHVARLPQLDCIVLDASQGELLSTEKVITIIQGMPKHTQAWLCGPNSLKELVTEAWYRVGMRGRIHSERFDFRGAYNPGELLEMGKHLIAKRFTKVSNNLDYKSNAATGT